MEFQIRFSFKKSAFQCHMGKSGYALSIKFYLHEINFAIAVYDNLKKKKPLMSFPFEILGKCINLLNLMMATAVDLLNIFNQAGEYGQGF
jgi:hypothetical protein